MPRHTAQPTRRAAAGSPAETGSSMTGNAPANVPAAHRPKDAAPPPPNKIHTKLCRHFEQGRCSWGDSCRFLHAATKQMRRPTPHVDVGNAAAKEARPVRADRHPRPGSPAEKPIPPSAAPEAGEAPCRPDQARACQGDHRVATPNASIATYPRAGSPMDGYGQQPATTVKPPTTFFDSQTSYPGGSFANAPTSYAQHRATPQGTVPSHNATPFATPSSVRRQDTDLGGSIRSPQQSGGGLPAYERPPSYGASLTEHPMPRTNPTSPETGNGGPLPGAMGGMSRPGGRPGQLMNFSPATNGTQPPQGYSTSPNAAGKSPTPTRYAHNPYQSSPLSPGMARRTPPTAGSQVGLVPPVADADSDLPPVPGPLPMLPKSLMQATRPASS
uniref:C3H1-type domain-containing protein n=1 Tax=Neobodo designis TaxID=312471 RepID=A0A7S1R1X0_NEODS|mmetsp:Transcript_6956/g.21786  ORF Transcript_6956/g.21786 Transcript_6956/m.21786 type:complete len:386 (+) Transcript_6956:149-1306(+)